MIAKVLTTRPQFYLEIAHCKYNSFAQVCSSSLVLSEPSDDAANQVIPGHGNPQMRRTLFDGCLFKFHSVTYQTFYQVFEKTSQQTYLHNKMPEKTFQIPPRAIKHQLTCHIELTSGSFLIGRRGILVIPTILWRLFISIPCLQKHLKRQ